MSSQRRPNPETNFAFFATWRPGTDALDPQFDGLDLPFENRPPHRVEERLRSLDPTRTMAVLQLQVTAVHWYSFGKEVPIPKKGVVQWARKCGPIREALINGPLHHTAHDRGHSPRSLASSDPRTPLQVGSNRGRPGRAQCDQVGAPRLRRGCLFALIIAPLLGKCSGRLCRCQHCIVQALLVPVGRESAAPLQMSAVSGE